MNLGQESWWSDGMRTDDEIKEAYLSSVVDASAAVASSLRKDIGWNTDMQLAACMAHSQLHLFEELCSVPVSTEIHVRNEDAIKALVKAADSSMGQRVLQDLLISFTAPRTALSVRRTLLMDRDLIEALQRSEHAHVLQLANTTATQGAEAMWRDGDELCRCCILLSGFAMLYSKSSANIRNGPPFRGLAHLPFMTLAQSVSTRTSGDTTGRKRQKTEYMLMLALGEYFTVSTEATTDDTAVVCPTTVLSRGIGIEGLSDCLSCLMHHCPPHSKR